MANSITASLSTAIPANWLNGVLLGASRAAGVIAQTGVQIAVGALAGPAAIGALQIHMSWSALLGEVVGAGEPTKALRDHSIDQNQGRHHAIGEALERSMKRIGVYSALLAATVGLILLTPLGSALFADSSILLIAILVSAPLFAAARLLAETLKALNHPLLAVTFENTLLPSCVLIACAVVAMGLATASIEALLTSAVIGMALMPATLAVAIRRSLKKSRTATPQLATTNRVRQRNEQWHFWLGGLLNIAFLQLPFLIMPWLVSAEEIGAFAVAHKLVNIVTTLLILMTAIYGPRFAHAAAQGNSSELAKLLRETQLLSLAIFVPLASALLLLTEPLAYLFSLASNDFAPILYLLAAGQCINAATGLSGVLLNMSGAARTEMRTLLGACTITTIGAIPLGILYGSYGVAIAIAAGIAARNVASFIAARSHLNSLRTIQR